MEISKSANLHLKKLIAETQLREPVVTIMRGLLTTGEDTGWSVALYEKKELGGAQTHLQDGLVIFLDEKWRAELNTSMLDIQGGKFVVTNYLGGPASGIET